MADGRITCDIKFSDEKQQQEKRPVQPGESVDFSVTVAIPPHWQKTRLFLTLSSELTVLSAKLSHAGAAPRVPLEPGSHFTGHIPPAAPDPGWDWGATVLLADIPATDIMTIGDHNQLLQLTWLVKVQVNKNVTTSKIAHVNLYVLQNQEDDVVLHQQDTIRTGLLPSPEFTLTDPALVTRHGEIWIHGRFTKPLLTQYSLRFEYAVGSKVYKPVAQGDINHHPSDSAFSVHLPDGDFPESSHQLKTYSGVKLRAAYSAGQDVKGEYYEQGGIEINVDNTLPEFSRTKLSVQEDKLHVEGKVQGTPGQQKKNPVIHVGIDWTKESDITKCELNHEGNNLWNFSHSTEFKYIRGPLYPTLRAENKAGCVGEQGELFASAHGIIDIKLKSSPLSKLNTASAVVFTMTLNVDIRRINVKAWFDTNSLFTYDENRPASVTPATPTMTVFPHWTGMTDGANQLISCTGTPAKSYTVTVPVIARGEAVAGESDLIISISEPPSTGGIPKSTFAGETIYMLNLKN
jgi:hypothetical protein